jgi:hypothetical protein
MNEKADGLKMEIKSQKSLHMDINLDDSQLIPIPMGF